MTKTITTEVTDSQYRCLEYITIDPADFVENAATFRAHLAKQEILPLLVAYCNEKNISLATGESAQIEQAYTLGVIKTAKQRDAEFEEDFKNKQENN